MHWVASSLAASLTSFEQACKETLVVVAFVGELGFGVFLDKWARQEQSFFSPNSKYEFKLIEHRQAVDEYDEWFRMILEM